MKFLLLISLLAGVAAQNSDSLDPCKDAYDKCQMDWVLSSTVRKTVELKCQGAVTWKKCLSAAAETGVCTGAEATPIILDQLVAAYCDPSDFDGCKAAEATCKKAWEDESAKATSSEKCDVAKRWKKCVEAAVATGHCKSVAAEVTAEESDSCKSAVIAPACQAKVDTCKSKWSAKYTDEHPTTVKCALADDWASCFNQAVRSAECTDAVLDYPTELSLQEAFCFILEVDQCKSGQDLCRDTWSAQLSSAKGKTARCDAAVGWQTCVTDPNLLAQCSSGVDVPDEVTDALSNYCPTDDAPESCTSREVKCAEKFKAADGKDRCKNAKAWRSCLQKVTKEGCTVEYPLALTKEESGFCKGNGVDVSCPARIAKCKANFDSKDAGKDRCEQAKKWRSCLKQLVDVCNIKKFPQALNMLEATSCFHQQVDCLSKQTQCRTDYINKVKVTGESCTLAREWRDCLLGVMSNDKCAVTLPLEMNLAEANNCYRRPGTTLCGDEQAKCKKAFEAAPSGSDRCKNARTWRKCLEKLVSSCSVTFPMDLNMAEATSCYNTQKSADSSKDAGGAPMTCSARMSQCKQDNVLASSDVTSRCAQARSWRKCLESLMSQCRVNFPRDLDVLEASTCFKSAPGSVKKDADDDDKDDDDKSGGNSCAKRLKNCRPKNPSTCDDAKKWRRCLDPLRVDCGGMTIYPQELNSLQANTCF